MGLSLWDSPDRWIADPLGYVFLPRAMLAIGKALFPNDWTGNEPYLATCLTFDQAVIDLFRQRPGTPPDWPTVAQARQKVAEERERQRKEDLEKAKKAGDRVIRRFPPSASNRRSADVQAASPPNVKSQMAWRDEAAFHAHRQAAQRYAEVCRAVADALRSGRLLCGLRPREGGGVTPGRREWWETEGGRLSIRFQAFKLSRKEPFSNGLRNDAEWICIERASLNAFLARLNSSLASTTRAESDAVRHLTGKLEENPYLSKTEAKAECKRFGIGQRAFQRVWPKARENEGLPAKAPAGRKKNRRT